MFTQIAKNMQFKMTLRTLLFVCAIGLFFSSCQKDDPTEPKDHIDIETKDATWTKLSIGTAQRHIGYLRQYRRHPGCGHHVQDLYDYR